MTPDTRLCRHTRLVFGSKTRERGVAHGTARAEPASTTSASPCPTSSRRAASWSTCWAASTCTRSGPFVHDDSDWMAEHLERAPAHGHAAQQLLPLRRPGHLRGLLVRGPRPAHRAAAQQRHRRPPRRPLRRRPRRRRGLPARARRPGARRADGQQRRPRGPALGLLPGALGHAVRARLLSRRQGRLPHPGGVRVTASLDPTSAPPARGSPATCARRSSAARSPPASGSGRRRWPSGSAPAGCRCARRCACSRPRGSPSTSGNKGARVPKPVDARGRRHLPDAGTAGAAGAGREHPAPDRRRRRPARAASRTQIEADATRRRRVPRAGPGVPPAAYAGCPIEQLTGYGRPAVEHHPALPPGVRHAHRARPASG